MDKLHKQKEERSAKKEVGHQSVWWSEETRYYQIENSLVVLGNTATWTFRIQRKDMQRNIVLDNKNETSKGANRSHQSVFLLYCGWKSSEQYSDGLNTASYESLHNLNNKYCPKGEHYSNSIYETRKDLACLDWNNRKEGIPPITWKKFDIQNLNDLTQRLQTQNNPDAMNTNDN
jgi:hypothetical protein